MQTGKEKEKEMSDVKPKIKGARKYRRPARAAGPTKKDFSTKVLGLESHTFDIGNAKYAAKYKKTVDSIANYIQREYKGGADIAKAIKELSLPSLQIPGFPKARTGETVVDPGDIYLGSRMQPQSRSRLCNSRRTRSAHMRLSSGSARPTSTASYKGLPRSCRPRLIKTSCSSS